MLLSGTTVDTTHYYTANHRLYRETELTAIKYLPLIWSHSVTVTAVLYHQISSILHLIKIILRQ